MNETNTHTHTQSAKWQSSQSPHTVRVMPAWPTTQHTWRSSADVAFQDASPVIRKSHPSKKPIQTLVLDTMSSVTLAPECLQLPWHRKQKKQQQQEQLILKECSS
eukprot:scaffold1900_cov183-Ochromonas_danica.AAC.9